MLIGSKQENSINNGSTKIGNLGHTETDLNVLVSRVFEEVFGFGPKHYLFFIFCDTLNTIFNLIFRFLPYFVFEIIVKHQNLTNRATSLPIFN